MKSLILFAVLVIGARCQSFSQCDTFILKLDCSTRALSPTCGSNGVDYQNSLHVTALTSCKGAGVTSPGMTTTGRMTTTAGGPMTTLDPLFINHNQLQDFFCLELMHEACPTNTERVCGTDGVTYSNVCEFEKSRCAHKNLQ
ncbi:hypothetical protein MAR_016612, partial [Mya arenaria]